MQLSREEIWAAADELAREGGTPTLQAVRERLGRGSFGKITPAMAEWRERQSVHQGIETPMPLDLRTRGQAHVEQLWTAAMAAANASLQPEREGLRVARCQLAQEQQDFAVLADELSAQVDRLQAALATAEHTTVRIESELLDARAEVAAFKARYDDAERLRAEERTERQGLQLELDAARGELLALKAQRAA